MMSEATKADVTLEGDSKVKQKRNNQIPLVLHHSPSISEHDCCSLSKPRPHKPRAVLLNLITMIY